MIVQFSDGEQIAPTATAGQHRSGLCRGLRDCDGLGVALAILAAAALGLAALAGVLALVCGDGFAARDAHPHVTRVGDRLTNGPARNTRVCDIEKIGSWAFQIDPGLGTYLLNLYENKINHHNDLARFGGLGCAR